MATAMGLDPSDVKQTATKWRITMRLGDTVVKIHVYQMKPGTLLLDWTHCEGNDRVVPALWWRHLLAGLRPYVTGPPGFVVTEGPPQASTVYTVRPLPAAQDE